jgi:sortase A
MVMIGLGLAAIPLVIFSALATERKYNSPFDQLDYEQGSGQGFLPVLQLPTLAPRTTQAAAGTPQPGVVATPTLSLQARGAPTLEGVPTDPTITAGSARPQGLAPDTLYIPALELRVPVVPAHYRLIDFEGQTYQQWEAPNRLAAGWQVDSAGLGAPGNTLLYGHHNIYGKVFEDLYTLKEGQVIELRSGDEIFTYRIVLNMILEEKFQPLEVRLENARWLLPSNDERITLVTCWPANDNTHRVIVVAVREKPLSFTTIPVTGEAGGEDAAAAEAASSDEVRLAPPLDSSLDVEFGKPPDLAANPGLEPERLLIPIINLFVPVLHADDFAVESENGTTVQWWAPEAVAAGWQPDTAGLGAPGNTVLYGYHNIYGSVFQDLHLLLVGQVIQLKAGEEIFSYRVAFTKIIDERCPAWNLASDALRWILPSTDERLTLVTCYPPEGSSQRLIVVAIPDP